MLKTSKARWKLLKIYRRISLWPWMWKMKGILKHKTENKCACISVRYIYIYIKQICIWPIGQITNAKIWENAVRISQTQWFGTVHMFSFPFPVVQESRHSLVGSLTESLTGLQSIPEGLQFHLQFQRGTGCWRKSSPWGCRICPWPLASLKSEMKRTSAASVPPPSESLKIKGFSPKRNYLHLINLEV